MRYTPCLTRKNAECNTVKLANYVTSCSENLEMHHFEKKKISGKFGKPRARFLCDHSLFLCCGRKLYGHDDGEFVELTPPFFFFQKNGAPWNLCCKLHSYRVWALTRSRVGIVTLVCFVYTKRVLTCGCGQLVGNLKRPVLPYRPSTESSSRGCPQLYVKKNSHAV